MPSRNSGDSASLPPKAASPGASVGASSDPPLLALNAVSARYGQGPSVLQNVSLSVGRGQLVALLGPNGSGKSTALRLASGLLRPSRGSVLIENIPVSEWDVRAMARRVAVVPQTVSVAFDFTVFEVVAMGRSPYLGPFERLGKRDAELVERLIDDLDLGSLHDRPVRSLSGGEQKRVALARALAQEPALVLLDEPTANLDIRHVHRWHEVLGDMIRNADVGCLAVMHDLNEAARYADEVYLLNRGRLVACGPATQTLTPELLSKTFEVSIQRFQAVGADVSWFATAGAGATDALAN